MAFVSDRRHRFWIRQSGGSKQRRDFGHGLRCILAPAARLANVDELDWRRHASSRAFCLIGQRRKKPLLLRASNHDIVTGFDGLLKTRRLSAAQRGVQREVLVQRC